MSLADDMAVFFDLDCEPVTFLAPGYFITGRALVNNIDPNVMPLDGRPAISSLSLSVIASEVPGISTEWSVVVRGLQRPVLDVNDADPCLWIITIGDPEEEE